MSNKKDESTEAMRQEILPKSYCDPAMRGGGGMTLAMYLAHEGIEIPTRWEHNPNIRDSLGMTVAMYLACGVKEITSQWEHDPTL